MVDFKKKFHSLKVRDILITLIVIMLATNLNLLVSKHFFQVDLTSEGRYTLSNATKNILKKLDDIVYVDVYLDGDFPAGFKRLQTSIEETLDVFHSYAGDKIQYRFIDPSSAKSSRSKNEYYQYLANMGIQPTNIHATENGKKIEKIIFPGAIISYGGKELGVMLFKGNKSAPPQERLNQSVEGVEYELISSIKKLTQRKRKHVAILSEDSHIRPNELAGLQACLKDNYELTISTLQQLPNLMPFDAVLLLRPKSSYIPRQEYELDQYVMNGGKLLVFGEGFKIDTDSLKSSGRAFATPIQGGIDNLLFKWGIKKDGNIIQDLNAGTYPIVTGNMGDQPQIQLMPFPYYPLINQFGKNPIVNNLDAIKMDYASALDTVKVAGIRKTPLMFSSPYSRTVQAPVLIELTNMRGQIDPKKFNQGPFATAYLLEGKFTSIYKDRFLPGFANSKTFKAETADNKIMVVGDADILLNKINPRDGQPVPLGVDPYSQQDYAHADFIKNSLSYLLDDNGIIIARNKTLKIRPLDKVKVLEEQTFWQTLNIALPVLLILLLGVIWYFVRKQRYSKF
ncbi:gliding motility-associated ABC transporter substrate-binding protein GldG [Persicobacter psychrovividus]|uniref:Gliding motility-associated ABC transporter substrate-binding protein GldG n=1 Tax=Persicobacter psychrovividus TaxID=387638 RepID=A0ABM7VFF7_9BACT|nr:gliding motility-associated ABC transporter substrate-binding protein GldG [Persicobacter psychrovividus]